MHDSRCNICTNRAVRDLVDAALAAGVRPADVWSKYGTAGLQTSRASLYRHSGHYERPRAAAPLWFGDTPVGELVADQSRLVRRNVEEYANALERGDHSAAARYSHEAQQGMSTLLRAGVETEDLAVAYVSLEDWYSVLGYSVLYDPDAGDALAGVADRIGKSELATELREFATKVRAGDLDHLIKKEK